MLTLTIEPPFYEKITQGARCSHCRGPYLRIREYFRDGEFGKRLAFSSVCLNCYRMRSRDNNDVLHIIRHTGEPEKRIVVDAPYP
jgi:hypothetical protein